MLVDYRGGSGYILICFSGLIGAYTPKQRLSNDFFTHAEVLIYYWFFFFTWCQFKNQEVEGQEESEFSNSALLNGEFRIARLPFTFCRLTLNGSTAGQITMVRFLLLMGCLKNVFCNACDLKSSEIQCHSLNRIKQEQVYKKATCFASRHTGVL